MVQIDHSIAKRLEARRDNDEEIDDLLRRLLAETAEEVSLESVLEQLLEHYDRITVP